jgi:hypothetical protein
VKTKQDYRVKIKVGDAEMEVQGAQSGVVAIVEALSEVLRGARRTLSPSAAVAPSSLPTQTGRTSPIDIRSFFAEKQPSSDVEAAAVAAYFNQYLAPEGTRRDTIDSTSLQEAFRQARRPLPARTIYTLQNARNAGYLESAGEGGQYRLNAVGYNLVEHTLGSSQGTEERKSKSRKKRHLKLAKKK